MTQIDKYFKKHLDRLEAEPSGNLWKKLSWMLMINKRYIWFALIFISIVIPSALFYSTFKDNQSLPTGETPEAKQDINIVSNKKQSENTYNKNIINGIDFEENKIKVSNIDKKNENDNQEGDFERTHTESFSTITSKLAPDNNKSVYKGTAEPTKSKYYKLKAIPFYTLETQTTFPAPITISGKRIMNNADESEQEKDKVNSHWTTGIYVNPAYVTTNLKGDDIYNDCINNRENSEDNIFTIGASAELKYSISNFFIKSGIGYAVYGQSGNHSYSTDMIDEQQSYYEHDTTWAWVYDPPEIYQYPLAIDSTFIKVYQTATTLSKNRYNYIEIPILFGYQFAENKTVGYEIATGCSFGFLVSAKGELPSPVDNGLNVINKSSDFIKNSSINYIFQLGIKFKLNEKTNFVVNPFFKRSLQSTFESNYPVSQKFNIFGLSLGIDIKL